MKFSLGKKVLVFVKILVFSHSVIHLPVRVCPPSVESPLISHSKSVSIATDLWGSLSFRKMFSANFLTTLVTTTPCKAVTRCGFS